MTVGFGMRNCSFWQTDIRVHVTCDLPWLSWKFCRSQEAFSRRGFDRYYGEYTLGMYILLQAWNVESSCKLKYHSLKLSLMMLQRRDLSSLKLHRNTLMDTWQVRLSRHFCLQFNCCSKKNSPSKYYYKMKESSLNLLLATQALPQHHGYICLPSDFLRLFENTKRDENTHDVKVCLTSCCLFAISRTLRGNTHSDTNSDTHSDWHLKIVQEKEWYQNHVRKSYSICFSEHGYVIIDLCRKKIMLWTSGCNFIWTLCELHVVTSCGAILHASSQWEGDYSLEIKVLTKKTWKNDLKHWQ